MNLNKLWYIHTVEYYSAIKRNAVLTRSKIWMNLKNMSERSQTQKFPSYMIPFMENIQNRQIRRDRKWISDQQEIGEGRNRVWLLNGHGVSYWGGWWKFLKLERAGVTQHGEGVKALNATELHTLKCLNVSCMNFTTVFLSEVEIAGPRQKQGSGERDGERRAGETRTSCDLLQEIY